MTKTLLATAAILAAIGTQVSAQTAAPVPAPAAPVAGQHGAWAQHDQTRAEATQRAQAMFQRLDLNRDGVLTLAEVQQAAAQFEAQRGDAGEGKGGGMHAGRFERMFGGAQSLTLQQFVASALTRFDRMDLNHDGTVTAAEREQARAAFQANRPQ
jgi:Ca2+-binding EF-hand superfamily protein